MQKESSVRFYESAGSLFCCMKKAVVVKGKSTALASQSCWNALDGSLVNNTATAKM